jgi:hypothetical protein
MRFHLVSLIVLWFIVGTATVDGQTVVPPSPAAPPGSPGAPARPATAGDGLFAAADFAGAERAYRATLRAGLRDASAELGLARIAVYRNDLDEAERHARALAADDPSDPRANVILAAIAARRDDSRDYRAAITSAEIDVPLQQIDPLPQVDALVNGKLAHLAIDTGGPGLDLSAAFVEALGIPTQTGGEGVFAGGLRAALRTGHVERLDFGGASISSIPVNVPERMPPGIDGVIGTKILYRFLSTIDYARQRLVLRPKSASSAFEAAAAERGAAIVPMLLVPDHFIFARARVAAAPEALFNIDTGGGGIGVEVTKAELQAAAIVPDASHPMPFLGGGGATRALPFTTDVTVGRRTIGGVPGVYLPDGDRYGIFPFRVAGALSQETFRRGALTFDFSAMKLVFEAP